MAFIQGKISKPADALPELVKFLTSNSELVAGNQNWTKVHDYTDSGGEPGFVLKASGIGGNEWYLAAHTVIDKNLSYANIHAAVLVDYDINVVGDFTKQPRFNGQTSIVMLHPQDEIKYTFIGNEKRVVGTFDADQQNHNFYFGCFNPYGDIAYYKRPLLQVGSSRYYNWAWGDTKEHQSGWLDQDSTVNYSAKDQHCFNLLFKPNEQAIPFASSGYDNWKDTHAQRHYLPFGDHQTLSELRVCSDVTLFFSHGVEHEVFGFLDGVVKCGYSSSGDKAGDTIIANNGEKFLLVKSGFLSSLWGLRLA